MQITLVPFSQPNLSLLVYRHTIREAFDDNNPTLPHVASNLQITDNLTKASTRNRHQFRTCTSGTNEVRVHKKQKKPKKF